MEQNSSNIGTNEQAVPVGLGILARVSPPSTRTLTYKHISHSTDDILSYINDRRKGIVKSLKTRWDKFNKVCMGGIEPNVIISIAGISGSGKSSLANSLETDLIDLNPTEDIVVLSFNFEIKYID